MGQCKCAGEIREGGGHKSPGQSLINVLSVPSTVHLKLRFAFRWNVLPHGGHFINNFVKIQVGEVCPQFCKLLQPDSPFNLQSHSQRVECKLARSQSFTDNQLHLFPCPASYHTRIILWLLYINLNCISILIHLWNTALDVICQATRAIQKNESRFFRVDFVYVVSVLL